MSIDAMPTNTQRTVLLTGAGSGIGYAVAKQLAGQGYRVFAGVLNQPERDRVAELGGNIMPIEFDVSDEGDVQRAFINIASQLDGRPLWALLNIAGVTSNGPLLDLDAKTFSQLLSVNLVGVHNVTRAFLPLLQGIENSRVINISSASGSRTMPFTGGYSASKFGVEALCAAMRMEFKPFGIKVVTIAPGLINTPMAEQIKRELSRPSSNPAYAKPLKLFLEKTLESSKRGIPMERIVATITNAVACAKPKRRYELHHSYIRDVLLMRLLPVGVRESIVTNILGLQRKKLDGS